MYLRRQFLERIAQTSEVPQGFIISKAKGIYLFNENDEPYLDLISGFGVNNIGHSHPEVIKAIHDQSGKYLHSTVYGEHIQSPQLRLASLLSGLLPSSLNSFHFLVSGSEAVDAALKLARLSTGRAEIVVCKNAYHGSTMAAEALRSDESHKAPFLPLIPGIRFIEFGNIDDLKQISLSTAAVITEVVQAEAGIRQADQTWWKALRKTCDEYGCLLMLDEIQTGLGRCGPLYAFMSTGVIPDVLITGKALGAGLPLSAIIASNELLRNFSHKLPLGSITTFGGHPLSCAAAEAGLRILLQERWMDSSPEKAKLICSHLQQMEFHKLRSAGLFIAVELNNPNQLMDLIRKLFENKILAEGFLFSPNALRIAPPLCISESEIEKLCAVISKIKNN